MFRSGPSQPASPVLRFMPAERRIGNQLLSNALDRNAHLKGAGIPQSPLATEMAGAQACVRPKSGKPGPEIAVLGRAEAKQAHNQLTAGPPPTGSEDPRGADERRVMAPAAAGFILADGEGNPLYANSQARAILSYPEGPRSFRPAWSSLRKAVFPLFNQQNFRAGSTCRIETMSGSRKYSCLAIFLDKPRGQPKGEGSVAIVLERHRDAPSTFTKAASQRFHLTEREQQVVEFLIRGLTNKEIAARMQISPNTVRAFIRMVMGKLGISTRSGIVGMVFRDLDNFTTWNGEQERLGEG